MPTSGYNKASTSLYLSQASLYDAFFFSSHDNFMTLGPYLLCMAAASVIEICYVYLIVALAVLLNSFALSLLSEPIALLMQNSIPKYVNDTANLFAFMVRPSPSVRINVE
jgi:hypothetical protein